MSATPITLPALGDDLSSWTTWNGTSEITATNGYYIAVAETESDFTCERVGQTIVKVGTEYTITYVDGSTPMSGLTPTTYISGRGATLPTEVTKEHYTFNGWYTSSTGGERVTEIRAEETGDKTVYARFTGETLELEGHLARCTMVASIGSELVDYAIYGETLDVVITPTSPYLLPSTITVAIGGVELATTDYTYRQAVSPTTQQSIGVVQIDGSKVTGKVEITCECNGTL